MRLIDADKLKSDYIVTTTTTNTPCHLYVSKEQINNAPTIKVESVRHGRWIECESESENGIRFHKCSECGKGDMYQGTFTDWNGRGFSFYFKREYCPVCGAKMDLDEVNK